MLEKIFKLKENNTTARTEIIAGLTTFMTMAYIIALNPNLLTGFGKDTMPELWNGVFLATCIASAIGTIVMAFLANKPFAMAPGMGLNSFFAVVVTNIVALTGMTYVASFQAALCIVLVEGIVFLILSVLNIREKIVDAIPLGVRLGIAPAIGLMLLNIGVGSNAGIYSENGGPFYAMRDFFGALTPSLAKTNMGSGYSAMVLSVVTMFVGLFAIVVLTQRGVKGAVLLGMLISSIIYWAGEAIFLGTNPFASLATASFVPAFGDMASTTLFKFDFRGFAEIGWFTAITLIITFCIIDMFDTIGTLVGTASRAGMLDKNGKMPNMKLRFLSQHLNSCHCSLQCRLCLVNIELEFIVHIVDRNIKGISIRSQCGSQIREEISKILLGSGKGANLQIEFGRSSGRGFGTDIGDLSDIVVGGIGTFFTEHAVLLQPAELSDGVVKLSGVLLDIHSIILSILTGGGKIPGCILVQFYDGIIDTAKFALFMCVVFRQLSGRVRRQIIIVNSIENCTHRYLLSPP